MCDQENSPQASWYAEPVAAALVGADAAAVAAFDVTGSSATVPSAANGLDYRQVHHLAVPAEHAPDVSFPDLVEQYRSKSQTCQIFRGLTRYRIFVVFDACFPPHESRRAWSIL